MRAIIFYPARSIGYGSWNFRRSDEWRRHARRRLWPAHDGPARQGMMNNMGTMSNMMREMQHMVNKYHMTPEQQRQVTDLMTQMGQMMQQMVAHVFVNGAAAPRAFLGNATAPEHLERTGGTPTLN